jgi:hypothetical protein
MQTSRPARLLAAAALALTVSAASGAVPITWDFATTNTSNAGGVPFGFAGHGDPYANTDFEMGIQPPGTVPGSFAVFGSVTKGANYTYAGIGFPFSNGGTIDLTNTAQTVTFKARLANAGDHATGWFFKVESTGSPSPAGVAMAGLTTTDQNFSFPLTGAAVANLATANQIVIVSNPPTGAGTVPVSLVITDLRVDPGPASLPVKPTVTNFDQNYNTGTTINNQGGDTHVAAGRQLANEDAAMTTAIVSIGGGNQAFQELGSFATVAGDGYYYAVMYVDLQPASKAPVQIVGPTTLQVVARTMANNNCNWKVRIEDTVNPDYTMDWQPLALTNTLQTFNIPLSAFNGSNGFAPDLSTATVITLFATDGPGASPTTVNVGLQVNRIRLFNPATVGDWNLY